MKYAFSLLALIFAFPALAATPACNPAEVLAAVNAKASPYFAPGAKARVGYAGGIVVGGKLNVMLLVDDFDVKNAYGVGVEVFTIVGSSLASDTTAWIAVVDANNCELKDSWEALHTGGGGL